MAGGGLTAGNLDQLRRLAALDRYERFAAAKRRRASRKLLRMRTLRSKLLTCGRTESVRFCQ